MAKRCTSQLGALYLNQGGMKEAEDMYLRALARYKHTSTLNLVNKLAVWYKTQGKIKKAEKLSQRGLAGYEKTWGSEHTISMTLDAINQSKIWQIYIRIKAR